MGAREAGSDMKSAELSGSCVHRGFQRGHGHAEWSRSGGQSRSGSEAVARRTSAEGELGTSGRGWSTWDCSQVPGMKVQRNLSLLQEK